MAKLILGEGDSSDIINDINSNFTELYTAAGLGSPTYTITLGDWLTIRNQINEMYLELMIAVVPTTTTSTTTTTTVAPTTTLVTTTLSGTTTTLIPTTTLTTTTYHTTTSTSTTTGVTDLLDSLIGYWKLDETEGTTAYDETANNLDGTTDATINQTGKIGKCYSFTTGQEVGMGTSALLKPTSAFTLAAWFKQYSYQGTIMSNGVVSGDGWALYTAGGTGIPTFTSYVNYSYQSVAGSTSVTTGTPLVWHHVVFTYDGTNGRMYVDGELDGGPTSLSNGIDYNAASTFQLGTAGTIGGQCTGSIDEVGVWGRALSAGEIAELYNSGSGLTYPFS